LHDSQKEGVDCVVLSFHLLNV